jgi:acetylornithine deacetylase/succinyl-diaminopimelate desuccinylase-like protein
MPMVISSHTDTVSGGGRFDGETSHASTTPMALRKDALVVAAQLVVDAESIIYAEDDAVGSTVGYLTVSPNTANMGPSDSTALPGMGFQPPAALFAASSENGWRPPFRPGARGPRRP